VGDDAVGGAMKIVPKGPEGIMERIRELQARMQHLGGAATAFDTDPAAPALRGEIGSSGFVPVNPMSDGYRVGAQQPPDELRSMIGQAASEAGISSDLLEALVAIESGFNPRAVSPKGAQGLTQLMPATARGLGVSDPFDPLQNLRGGARYLAQMLARFGDVKLALAAYNAGPGAVERFGRQIPPYAETIAYVQNVLARLEAGGRP